MPDTAAVPVRFLGVYPIGDTDVLALPVDRLNDAVEYYTGVLGFTLASRTVDAARLERDGASIGIAVNDADPEQASCYFPVSDIDALYAEYTARGVDPSPIRMNEHEGKTSRIFFVREPYGVCFCFGQASV